jgi:uridine phosphorylase
MDKISLLEFDSDRTALIEPSNLKGCNLPEHCIIVFYNSVIQHLKQDHVLEKIYEINSVLHSIEVFKLKQGDHFLCVVCPPGCGAPLAGSLLEILTALGCRKFVACGGAGVLKSELN